MDPVIAGRRLVDQRGELGRDEIGQRRGVASFERDAMADSTGRPVAGSSPGPYRLMSF